jgi:YgiT-type zinc finger domain-containing protein
VGDFDIEETEAMKPYGDCIYCGGEVEERVVRLDYRYHGQLFIIEGVRLGVCCQCGEKVLTAETAHKLEDLARRQEQPVTTVAVPVLKAE